VELSKLSEELMPLEMQQQILVTIGKIDFPDYDSLKQQALELAEHIANVEVGPENVKESKKLVAEVGKRLKELEDKRISIKKLMLEPYSNFETQVKEIVGIVKESEEMVRQQVKQLEEMERFHKQGAIETIWNKRILQYGFDDLFSFVDFLKPQHLNKTVSMDAIEKEMVQFLEKVDADLRAMEHMGNRWEVLDHYKQTKDLAQAISLANAEQERRQQLEKSKINKPSATHKIAFLVSVRCENEKELKLLEMIFKQNGFEFTIDKIS
jgi:uncharacterized protein DUF1351